MTLSGINYNMDDLNNGQVIQQALLLR